MARGQQSAPTGVEYGIRVYVFVVYTHRISKRRQVSGCFCGGFRDGREGDFFIFKLCSMCKLIKYCLKDSTEERKEAGYGVKSPSSEVRDHGQSPISLLPLLCIQKASYFTSLSLGSEIILVLAS